MCAVVHSQGLDAALNNPSTSQHDENESEAVRDDVSFFTSGSSSGASDFPIVAPAFTSHEKTAIAAWSAMLGSHGLRAAVTSNYEFLREALAVTPCSGDEPWWLVHKTPTGTVAVRLWPGSAAIVGTVPQALAMISAAIDRATPGATRAESGHRGP
jgi:hypothetical protein